eukprot:XP_011619331.1 PREDICTED: interferon-induced very large GTPase 1-like [Takifugu rubripes]
MDETRRKQLPKSSDESTMKTPEAEFSSLLGRLCLQDKYRQKLTPADFLKIRPPLEQEPGTCEKDVVLMFSQKLMLLDYTARYIPITQDDPDPGQSDLVPQSSTVEAEKDVFAAFLCVPDSSESKQQSVHPMDIQMALFHCSDSFLKQNLITKLSQCQYALPLLVPDPVTMDIQCPLWTFRQIKKTWKTTGNQDNSNTVTLKTVPICNAKTPMVSFFRLGSLSLSKSQLINNLISSRHNTFYHRDCQGSTKTRHLMEGVAEIAWYCPAGKSNDAFTDCTAFCNLHAVCTNTVKDHSPDKHSAPFHRPTGVNGFRFYGTKMFVVESCTTLVVSDDAFCPHHDSDVTIPYKQYKKAGERYASWEITSDGSLLPFWKWFTYRFQKELEQHYDLRFTGKEEIPNNWGEIKKEDAIKSLDEL